MTGELFLVAGAEFGIPHGELAAALHASRPPDTVEIRCPAPGADSRRTCGARLGMVMTGPRGAVVVVRKQPDPRMLDDAARLFRRTWPAKNPKAKDELWGLCWLLKSPPADLEFRCPRCRHEAWMPAEAIVSAHNAADLQVRVLVPTIR